MGNSLSARLNICVRFKLTDFCREISEILISIMQTLVAVITHSVTMLHSLLYCNIDWYFKM